MSGIKEFGQGFEIVRPVARDHQVLTALLTPEEKGRLQIIEESVRTYFTKKIDDLNADPNIIRRWPNIVYVGSEDLSMENRSGWYDDVNGTVFVVAEPSLKDLLMTASTVCHEVTHAIVDEQNPRYPTIKIPKDEIIYALGLEEAWVMWTELDFYRKFGGELFASEFRQKQAAGHTWCNSKEGRQFNRSVFRTLTPEQAAPFLTIIRGSYDPEPATDWDITLGMKYLRLIEETARTIGHHAALDEENPALSDEGKIALGMQFLDWYMMTNSTELYPHLERVFGKETTELLFVIDEQEGILLRPTMRMIREQQRKLGLK